MSDGSVVINAEPDPDVCELCGDATTEGDRDYMVGLDGSAAHVECLEQHGIWNREPEELR